MNVQVRLPGTEHWTNKGDVKLFLWNKVRRRSGQDPRHDPVRARLVDGLAADLRSRRAGPAGLLRDGIFRARRATTAGASTWRATAAPPRTATTTRRFRSAPTIALPPRLIFRSCAAAAPSSSTAFRPARCAPRLFAERHPEMVDRLALDATVWTGEGSPTLPSGARSCPSLSPRTAGRSTAPSCIRSSTATIPAPPRSA